MIAKKKKKKKKKKKIPLIYPKQNEIDIFYCSVNACGNVLLFEERYVFDYSFTKKGSSACGNKYIFIFIGMNFVFK